MEQLGGRWGLNNRFGRFCLLVFFVLLLVAWVSHVIQKNAVTLLMYFFFYLFLCRSGVSKNASVLAKKSSAGFVPWRTAARVGKNRYANSCQVYFNESQMDFSPGFAIYYSTAWPSDWFSVKNVKHKSVKPLSFVLFTVRHKLRKQGAQEGVSLKKVCLWLIWCSKLFLVVFFFASLFFKMKLRAEFDTGMATDSTKWMRGKILF